MDFLEWYRLIRMVSGERPRRATKKYKKKYPAPQDIPIMFAASAAVRRYTRATGM